MWLCFRVGLMNSREKGKRGEREWAWFLRHRGFDARRGVQYQGGPDSPDVVCPRLDYLHFEVKRSERFKPYDALEQGRTESRPDQVPVVAHRKNNKEWIVVMDADQFLRLIEPKWFAEDK